MLTEPRPAATIIIESLKREKRSVLMLKRVNTSGFFAGAHVFPGGVVNQRDKSQELAISEKDLTYAANALDLNDNPLRALAFFQSAIRETAEESGVLFAVDLDDQYPPASISARVIDEMTLGHSFYDVLKKHSLKPHIRALRPISWWITPELEKRRYDTRFFYAEMPLSQKVQINPSESTLGEFMAPSLTIKHYYEEKVLLAPPTLAILEALQPFSEKPNLAKLFENPNYPICPEVSLSETGQIMLILPGDKLSKHSSVQPLFKRTRFKITQNGRVI